MNKKFKPLDYSRGWDDYWRDHPQGYSPQEQMINWSGQLNAMIDFFNKYFDVDLAEYATDVMEGWYFDGRLDDIINEALFNSKADKTDIPINVKMFGAKGDGLTDDTAAILDAFNMTIETQRFLYFPNGSYLFKKDSVPVELITTNIRGNFIQCSSMIGENATIIIDGSIGFETSNVKHFKCMGLNFDLVNSFGTDKTSGDTNVVFCNSTPGNTKTRLYKDLIFNGVVTLLDGSQRCGAAIYESCLEGGYFNNITTYNLVTAVRVMEGENFTIDNINSFNFQTCIYTLGDVKKYNVLNVHAENTFEQSQTWLRKNDPVNPYPNLNGLDLFLGDGDDYVLQNLNAINPIERCVYSQGSNVRANNLRCVNADGFKFVGKGYDGIVKNIKVSDCVLVIDKDIVNAGKARAPLFTFYWTENVEVSNSRVIATDNVTGAQISSVITMSRHVKNLNIENVKCEAFVADSLLYVALRSESGLTPADYIVLENCKINNCFLKKNTQRPGSLFLYRRVEASEDAKLNYVAKNVRITNSQVEYGETPDSFMYTWDYVDGFYAENNKCNKLLNASGLPTSNPTTCNNIVLKENDIPFRQLTAVLTLLKTITLSNGSHLNFVKFINDGRTQEVTLAVYGGLTDEEMLPVFDNSAISIKIYLTTYETFTDLPDNYTIKVNADTGQYIGHIQGATLTDLVSTSPVTITVSAANSITLRGDTYSGKAIVEIDKP